MKGRFGIIILLTLAVFSFSLSPIFAQTPDDGSLILVTSPLPINLVTEPGKTVTTDLRVKNGGTKSETLEVGLMKFGAYGEDGKPKLLDRETGDDFFDWMTFSETSFPVAPNEWKTVTATIKVPDSAAFGYYYAVTFSRAKDAAPTAPRQTAIVGATATLVLLEVRVPNAKREIQVAQFSTDKMVYEFLPAAFTIKLSNTGNVHVAPRGNIFIKSGTKTDVAIVEVNPEKGSLLPDSNRVFTSEWKDGFPVYTPKVENGAELHDAKGALIKSLKWDFSRAHTLRWGRYTANLLLVYDDGTRDQAIEGTVSFWVIPWRLLAGAMLILLLTLFGLWSVMKPFFVRSRRT